MTTFIRRPSAMSCGASCCSLGHLPLRTEMRRTIAAMLLAGIAMPASAASFTSTGSGDWTSRTNWSGGVVPTAVDTATIAIGNPTVSGAVSISGLLIVGSASLNIGNGGKITTGSFGLTGGKLKGQGTLDVRTGTITQSAGTMGADHVQTSSYILSGGTINASAISFSTLFSLSGNGVVNVPTAQLIGGDGATMIQSGGTMNGTVTGITSYTQSGGAMGGSISTQIYNLTSASVTLTGTITVSDALNLGPTSGIAVVGATLSGVGDLFKTGASSVVLAGETMLDGLTVSDGTLTIGTGSSMNTASFSSAYIASGATVYVAQGSTLTIRVPNNIVNDGFLTNDGTVNDDLDNNFSFNNNSVYNANVSSNTGTIDNNTPGLWTGSILTNAGTITNHDDATWQGAVKANSGTVANKAGAVWTGGDVDGNIGTVSNQGRWSGDVNGNGTAGYWPGWTYGLIYNDKNAVWAGDVNGNNGSVRNVAGTWNGNVVDNDNTVMNDNSSDELDLGYWNGDVVGNHGLVFNAGGGIWSGDVLSNTGIVLSGRASHHVVATDESKWYGDILGNAGTIESDAFWYGDVRGNAGTIENTGWWKGDIYAGNTGTVYNAEDDFGVPVYDKIRPTWNGDVKGNDGTIFNIGADWIGDVDANTGSISNTRGSYDHFQLGDSTWTGDVESNAGHITNFVGSTWTGNVVANVGTITTAGLWNGNFGSAGTVNAQGTISGSFANAGLFKLTGSLTGISTLDNTGVLDMRGNGALQTLTVNDANFDSGGVFAVDVDSAGHADRIVATTATLGGTVEVAGMATGDSYNHLAHYTIASADNITGRFAGVTSDLAFLSPRISYADPLAVTLDLTRNDEGFLDAGTTPNQKAVAASVEGLGAGNPIFDAVLWLNQDEVAQAFDALSGAAQGSLANVSLEDAGLIADLMSSHLDQSFNALGDGEARIDNYVAGPVVDQGASLDTGLWGQLYGANLRANPGGVAAVDSTTSGLVVGLDGLLGQWRVGASLQAGTTGTVVQELNFSSQSVDYGGGVYGGTQWGETRLTLGAFYTRHAIHSSRDVVFPGFADTLHADYAGATAQVSANLSHEFDLGSVSITPFGNVALVRNSTDGFVESGGAAALSSAPDVIQATFATLGLGIDRQFAVADDMLLTANVRLGWRHTFGDPSGSVHALASGGNFSVVGTPLTSEVAVLSAGLNLDVSAQATLDLTYDGQLAAGVQTHALRATWNTRF